MQTISDTLLVQAPSGTAPAFRVESGGSGTASALNWNRIGISADSVDSQNTRVDGLQIFHSFGGSTTTGIRNAVESVANLTQATSTQSTLKFYSAGTFTADMASDDGGSAAAPKGAGFGINPVGILRANARNFNNITAAEFNCTAISGSSVYYKSVIQLTTGGGGPSENDTVQGSQYDCAIGISSQNGNGTRNGILFGPMNGQQPLSQNGNLLSTTGTATVFRGIDFSSYNFSDAVLVAKNVAINQGSISLSASNSGLELGSTSASNTPYVDFHSSGIANDYDARIIARGGSSTAGQGGLQLLSMQLGFFGATPVSKPVISGSRGGNAAVQGIISALVSLGLIVDNTSA